MTCQNIMLKDVYTVLPDVSVGSALDTLFKKKVRSLPVVDEAGKYYGFIHFRALLEKVLPSSVSMPEGLTSLAFMSDDTAYLAKQLLNVRKMKVEEIMVTDIPVLHMDTVFEEGLLQLYTCDTPLPILDKETGDFKGLFTKQVAIDRLMKLSEQEA